jgi:hypothetical protein
LEEYVFLQVLKEASRAKYEAENAKKAQQKAGSKRALHDNAPALAQPDSVVDGFSADIQQKPFVAKRPVGRPRRR